MAQGGMTQGGIALTHTAIWPSAGPFCASPFVRAQTKTTRGHATTTSRRPRRNRALRGRGADSGSQIAGYLRPGACGPPSTSSTPVRPKGRGVGRKVAAGDAGRATCHARAIRTNPNPCNPGIQTARYPPPTQHLPFQLRLVSLNPPKLSSSKRQFPGFAGSSLPFSILTSFPPFCSETRAGSSGAMEGSWRALFG